MDKTHTFELSKSGRGVLLGASVIAFCVTYFVFYPVIYAYRDEASYLAMSVLLKEGTLSIDLLKHPLTAFLTMGGKIIPMYPLGPSFLLLPFVLAGWKTVFLCGFLFHLLGTLYLHRIARLFEIDPLIPTILYLLFPPFALYSRTIMTDIPTAGFFLMGCYYYFSARSSKIAAGMAFGAALLLRPTNALIVLPFVIVSTVRAVRNKEWTPWLQFGVSMAPFALFVGIMNAYFYGSPFQTGYSVALPNMGNFSTEHFLPNFKHYLIHLNVMYPAMLAVFLFQKKVHRIELLWVAGIMLTFFSFHYFYDRFPKPWMDVFFSGRFMFPLTGFLILSYGEFGSRVLKRVPPMLSTALLTALVIVLAAAGGLIQYKHHGYLTNQKMMSDQIYAATTDQDILIYDAYAAELLQSEWGSRRYRRFETISQLEEVMSQYSGETLYLVRRVFRYQYERREIISDADARVIRQMGFKPVLHSNELEIYQWKA